MYLSIILLIFIIIICYFILKNEKVKGENIGNIGNILSDYFYYKFTENNMDYQGGNKR